MMTGTLLERLHCDCFECETFQLCPVRKVRDALQSDRLLLSSIATLMLSAVKRETLKRIYYTLVDVGIVHVVSARIL